MRMTRCAGVAVFAAAMLVFSSSRAQALELTTYTLAALRTPFGPCHNDGDCGGYFIRWDPESIEPNKQAALHINQLTISMTSEVVNLGGLHKAPGNVIQYAHL